MIAVLILEKHSNPRAKWYSTTLSDNIKLEKKIRDKADEGKIRAKLSEEFGVKPSDIFKFWLVNEEA